MPSQKSSARDLQRSVAVEPKRERGRRRVSAILDAAAVLIAERGYDATTMTEVAARSATAIGSLYRFFPTKDVLADALLDRYAGEITAKLGDLHGRAPGLGPAGVADALVDLVLDLRADRAAAVALVDTKDDGPARRQALRSAFGDGLAAILQALAPMLSRDRASVAALVVLHVMKTGPSLMTRGTQQEKAQRLDELRRLLKLYIVDLGAAPTFRDQSPFSSE